MDVTWASLGKFCFPDAGTAPWYRPLPPSSCLGSGHPTRQLSNHLAAQRQWARGQRMAENTKGIVDDSTERVKSARPPGFSFNSPSSVGFSITCHQTHTCYVNINDESAEGEGRSVSWEKQRLAWEGRWEQSYGHRAHRGPNPQRHAFSQRRPKSWLKREMHHSVQYRDAQCWNWLSTI